MPNLNVLVILESYFWLQFISSLYIYICFTLVSRDSLWVNFSLRKVKAPESEPEPSSVKRRRVEPPAPGSAAEKLQVTGATGRELGDMVGSWLGWRWDGKASIYLPVAGTWIFYDLFKMCCPFADFPTSYVRGHWITHWGRIKQYNYMARLVDFAFFGLVI